MATPFKIGTGILGLNLLLSLALMHPLRHVGPPLATTLAMTVNVALLAAILLRRGHLVPDAALWSRLARMAGATAVMALLLWGTRLWLAPQPGQHVSILALSVMVAGGMTAYGSAALALGLADIRRVGGALKRRLNRTAKAVG